MSEVEQEVGPYDPHQHAQALEEENKSLRESIADLQKALGSIAYFEGNKETPNLDISRNGAIKAYRNNIHVAKKALERLKARGHWVEEK